MFAAASEHGGQQQGLALVDTLCALGEEQRSVTSSEGEGEEEEEEEAGGEGAAAAAAGAEAAPVQVSGWRCRSSCLHACTVPFMH